MEIQVIGPGCASCKKLLTMVQDAVKQTETKAEVIYVTKMEDIMKTGVMSTPALIINGKVKAMGRVPGMNEIKMLISDEQ